MLVALMTRLNAISQMHNAQYAMMRNNMGMMSAMRNLSFGNAYNMASLAQLDRNFALSNAQNETMYLLASAQEKAAAQMLAAESKQNKISYVA